MRLGTDVEVLLLGDEPGTEATAREFGTHHVQDLARSEFGTPLISAAFTAVRTISCSPLLCYVNADIILMSDIVDAIRQVAGRRILMTGQRWDLDFDSPLDFGSPSWEADLRALVARIGRLHSLEAMDYFAFPQELVMDMPPFAVGRAIWDNWLLFHARAVGAEVIDATQAVMVVHQNHDYAHAQGGVRGVWYGPEAQRNRALAADMLYPFTLRDAPWALTPSGRVRRRNPADIVRLVQSTIALYLRMHPLARRSLRRILGAKDS